MTKTRYVGGFKQTIKEEVNDVPPAQPAKSRQKNTPVITETVADEPA